MNITYTDKLKDYLVSKGYKHLHVGVAEARNCCSGHVELAVVPVSDAKAEELLNDKYVKPNVIDTEIGDIIITARGLEYDDDIEFDYRNFLGAKDFVVKGIRAWSLR